MVQHKLIRKLGEGNFGRVWEARRLDTGRLIAVKVLIPEGSLTLAAAKSYWERSGAYRGEGVILPQLDHEHIINCFHTTGWATRWPQIFMDLMEGSLDNLISPDDTPCPIMAHNVFHQMLQALDYLSVRGYVHRDVKPENIFYTTLRGTTPTPITSVFSPPTWRSILPLSTWRTQPQYQFRLGDFGLCDSESNLTSWNPAHGTRLYLAPELLVGRASPARRAQSHKSDVWALYVTMLFVLDVHGVRETGEYLWVASAVGKAELRFAATLAGAAEGEPRARVMQEMARLEPVKRASAGEVLDEVFGGVGRVSE
ncbi:kinase-like domain-containing protein [Staphylotrichum tortipilum]|uniref:Kinase-like domain-containing protein n=1 Tax=Staphylotrichum tortipilum TaxID=2831512 RepID=A0AAN6MHE6_9PEZI|nr:kinase-like domain-containing protein [Staphylotrichum longicolle]